jgi:hypothetical protein
MREVCPRVVEKAYEGGGTPGVCPVALRLGGLESRRVCLAPGKPLRPSRRGMKQREGGCGEGRGGALSP